MFEWSDSDVESDRGGIWMHAISTPFCSDRVANQVELGRKQGVGEMP